MTKKTCENNDTDTNTGMESVKKIPYGITDYERIRNSNYYYIDKTQFIPALEKSGSYLFFIRPRRFGKSLFVSLLKSYYDIAYKDCFEELFKDTWIYSNPSRERGQYLVLNFNFSALDSNPNDLENFFLKYVRRVALDFIYKYDSYLVSDRDFFIKDINDSRSAGDILSSLLYLCNRTKQKLYVIIDEYDNFANNILSDAGKDAYHKLTHGVGLFRAFFNILKSGTTGTGAPVTRTFITGVSPITMDDVTSGYNIGKNISLEPAFNRMLGFTEEDITEIIEYYRSKGLIKDTHTTPSLIEIMTHWYGNYLFAKQDNTKTYNTDMVLYFFDHYLSRQEFPDNLIDRNVRIDYRKLRHLVIIDKKGTRAGQESPEPVVNGNFSKLKEIIENGETLTSLADGFPLEEMKQSKNFKSLLFYLGLLTIKEPYRNQLRLEIPNETIRHLYYDYIESIYRETGILSLDMEKYEELMTAMAYDGEWNPFFTFITGEINKSISLRDMIEGERMIQFFLNVYLGLSVLYIILPEREAGTRPQAIERNKLFPGEKTNAGLSQEIVTFSAGCNKGYADLLMEPFLAKYEDIKYSYIIELKYIKRSETKSQKEKKPKDISGEGKTSLDKKIQKLVKEAEAQLQQYSADEKLSQTLAKTTLIKLVLVFHGHEVVYINNVR